MNMILPSLIVLLLTTAAHASMLQPAKLQPSSGLDAASGLDTASGLGGRGSVRTRPDSADAWKARFPKQPNGRPRG